MTQANDTMNVTRQDLRVLPRVLKGLVKSMVPSIDYLDVECNTYPNFKLTVFNDCMVMVIPESNQIHKIIPIQYNKIKLWVADAFQIKGYRVYGIFNEQREEVDTAALDWFPDIDFRNGFIFEPGNIHRLIERNTRHFAFRRFHRYTGKKNQLLINVHKKNVVNNIIRNADVQLRTRMITSRGAKHIVSSNTVVIKT